MACPRGEKDSELITGRVGILSNEKGEVLKACCVWSAGLNPLYLEHGGGGCVSGGSRRVVCLVRCEKMRFKSRSGLGGTRLECHAGEFDLYAGNTLKVHT